MTETSLNLIASTLSALGLNYAFMEWNGKPAYPYFVGEYQEYDPMNEDGMQESDFILSGFSRTTYQVLEEAKETIKSYFTTTGKTVIADDGSAVAVFYSGSFPVPTGDAELKKIQINLKVKEWGSI